MFLEEFEYDAPRHVLITYLLIDFIGKYEMAILNQPSVPTRYFKLINKPCHYFLFMTYSPTFLNINDDIIYGLWPYYEITNIEE